MKKTTILTLLITSLSMGISAEEVMETSLDELFAIAEQNSRQIRVSITQHEASVENVKAAKSQLLPDLNLSLSGSYIGTPTVLSRGFSSSGTTTVPYAIGVGEVKNGSQPTPHWGNDFVAQVTQVIYSGGAISSGIKLAEQRERMAQLDVEKNRLEVRFLLTGYYLEICKLSNQLKVVEQNISLAEQLLKTMRARYAEGTALKNDITRYEYQLQSLELSKTKLTDAINIVNHHLVATLQLPEDTKLIPKDVVNPTDNPSEGNWQSQASTENISIRQAELAADMSQTEVRAVRSALFPNISLMIQNRLFGPYVTDLIPVDANINSWFVGLNIQYDLGNLWRKNHDIKRARINARQSAEQVSLVREEIDKALHANYMNYQTSQVEVDTQRKQVALADEHYQVTQNRYEKGLALLTDMLDASNMKLSADIDLVNAQINHIYNYYKLKYITGTL
ncbi:MAG: TolC family protein [Lepagella sp.]